MNVQANMTAGAGCINMAYFLPIAEYPQFILNQYQEVGQKPSTYRYAEKRNKSI